MADLKLKNYKISKKRIGKGAFSNVYKALNKNDKLVAIKKIYLDNTKNQTSFLKEFNLMRKLNHINIIKVYDIILEDKYTIYLILEYFKKGDLSIFIKDKHLDEKYVQHYSIHLKNGLEYLLSQNIIHRDLKPQNILVSDENILKICDFGFARYFTEDIMLGTICGSPLYMAPEIMFKKPYTIKSDLWSLGIIIYEMAYKCVPYKGNNIIELIQNIKNKKLDFPSNNILSDDYIELIYGLLQKNPNDRYEWNEFFNHKWFSTNLIQQEENNLLEISMSEPNFIQEVEHNLSNIKSFKYKSICEDINNSIEFNFNLKESDSSGDYLSINSFTDNDQEHIEHEIDNNFKNIDNETNSNSNSNSNSNTDITISKPININNKNKFNESYILVNSEKFVETTSIKYKNKGKSKSLSDSIKEYLSNSINFVKQGYDYISKSSSL
jgi:serine/threonine protein kinase